MSWLERKARYIKKIGRRTEFPTLPFLGIVDSGGGGGGGGSLGARTGVAWVDFFYYLYVSLPREYLCAYVCQHLPTL